MPWIEIDDGRSKYVTSEALARMEARAAASATSKAPYVRRNTLTAEERRGYEMQLGVPIEDRSHLDRVMEAGDFRFVDKGDRTSTAIDEMRRWKASGETEKERGAFHRPQRYGPA